MYFDPLSAMLVSLIADGIVVTGERSRGGIPSEYDLKRIKQDNSNLNAQIRQIKNQYGLDLPEMAYHKIQLYINITRNSFGFQHAHGQIIIDLDNQEYIIELLEACSKWHSKYPDKESKRKKEWYRDVISHGIFAGFRMYYIFFHTFPSNVVYWSDYSIGIQIMEGTTLPIYKFFTLNNAV